MIQGTLSDAEGTASTGSSGTSSGSGSHGGTVSGPSSLSREGTDVQRLLEDVMICALGSCSTTDGAGQWGFAAPASFAGGEVEFDIVGHGIADQLVVTIPAGAADIDLSLIHEGDAGTVVSQVMADGIALELKDLATSAAAE